MNSWDRQQDESSTAFMWFARYRDMGPERSLAKLGQTYGKTGAYTSQLETWSVANNWVKRAAAWDSHVDCIVQERNIEQIVAMRERHVKVAVALQNKVLQRLQTMNPDELTPSNLIRWFEIAVKIERLSRGELARVDTFQFDKHPSEMTDEELDAALLRFGITAA